MESPEPSDLAAPEMRLGSRVIPRASRAQRLLRGETLRADVTAPPDAGKADTAVLALLAKAPGVPKTRLGHGRGLRSRDKVFEVS